MKKNILATIILTLILSCKEEVKHKFTNNLIHETSPYLLQHAHNPVDWNAWNEKTLSKAKSENKLILISVGYASCHWCHVMETESFEDTLVAKLMNNNFTNIKVDREERPDVDKVYINAVQLMTGNGGWPLNVVALPDGRPVWGGTYFSKDQWIDALTQISKLYQENPEKLIEYADKLEHGINSLNIVELNTDEPTFEEPFIENTVKNWDAKFDYTYGGIKGSTKFMMPNNYHFLMRYAYQNTDKKLLDYVNLTLTKIAYGGVFDQIGGGFSRYSIDEKWHVPHFEKMLYDNAQLVSLYADAYLISNNELYKDVVKQTLVFIKNEMTTTNGAFYSSIDADSKNNEGKLEEGAFYVWTQEQLKTLLKTDFKLFSDYYNINDFGLWENNNYILVRNHDDNIILEKHNLTKEQLFVKKTKWKEILLKERNNRTKPRLDDKILTSWNALMMKGYLDAYRVFGENDFLKIAEKNANFILNNQIRKDGGINHVYKNGTSTINGYLEDYALTIDAFISLYENTFDQKWLLKAKELSNYALKHFYDDRSKMFFFTSDEDDKLLTRNIEYLDDVIPASNSVMAKNLHKLSLYFDNHQFSKTAITMLNNVKPEMNDHPQSFTNWFDLMLNHTNSYFEVVIVGKEALLKVNELNKTYIPNKLIAGSTSENNSLPLLENRYVSNNTYIYVCVNKTCKFPVNKVKEAIKLLKE
jgi:hypothetical protein